MKREAAAIISRHPFLIEPVESLHQLSDEGAARAEDDPELAPGHDCCAVCAGLADRPVTCPRCQSVQYCSQHHQMEDAQVHAAVCDALGWMQRADCLLAGQQLEAGPDETEAADTSAGPTKPQGGSRKDDMDGFQMPPRNSVGWQYVSPPKFLSVYPQEQSASEEAGPSRKRARNAVASQRDASQDTLVESGPEQAEDDAHLQLAAELAEHTAVLTYAYTAAHALQSSPAARAAVARAEAEQRPFELLVLGAAEDAELANLASWQVIASAVGLDVRIRFVGPEVPDELADTVKHLGRVEMHFIQGIYNADTVNQQGAGGGRAPDVFFAFNPGFTCPDYEWSDTVKALARAARSGPSVASGGGRASGSAPKPCLVTATNTKMEAQMEAEWLAEYGWHAEASVGSNPYTSLKLIQSGTLANDLYRKNAWLIIYVQRDEPSRAARGARGGRRSVKAAAKRAAKALYNTMFVPVARLLRKR